MPCGQEKSESPSQSRVVFADETDETPVEKQEVQIKQKPAEASVFFFVNGNPMEPDIHKMI